MSNSNKIVVIGSANVDMVIKVPHLPQVGETILGGKFQTLPGGKGANQAVSAQRSGGAVTFIACVGSDAFGQEAIEGYLHDCIDVSNIMKIPGEKTGVAQIMVDDHGRNMIAVSSGANACLTPDKILEKSEVIQDAEVLLAQLEIPLNSVIHAVEIAYKSKKTIILNPAPAQQLPDHLYSKIDYITPNETEAEYLTGIKIDNITSAKQAAEILLKKGTKNVIITLGDKGVYFTDGKVFEMIPAIGVDAVDSTAAGDTFNGAFATALSQGKQIFKAIQFAQAAAALSVTKLGAQSSVPFFNEITALLN